MLKHLAVNGISGRVVVPKGFNSDIFLYSGNSDIPFAFRAGSVKEIPRRIPRSNSQIAEFNNFTICECDKGVLCSYLGSPLFTAYVVGRDDSFDSSIASEAIFHLLRKAYELDPYKTPMPFASLMYGDIITEIADFCGCLSDIKKERSVILPTALSIPTSRQNSAFIAMALPAVALMYRRISALRGFNFELKVSNKLPCLAFSAKVLDGSTDISELKFLKELECFGGLKVICKVRACDDEDGANDMFVFSVAICPSSADPHDVLRAAAWNKQAERMLRDLDIEVKGRF